MTLKPFFSALALALLSSTAAQALSIGNITPTGIVPALELELPGTPALTGIFAFDLITDTGTYPAGNNILVTAALPNGAVFTTPVNNASVAGGSGVVQSGGAIGDDSVVFLVSIPAAGITNLRFTFDLELISCPAAGDVLTVSAAIDGSGTPIEQGTALSADLISACRSALTPSPATPDTTATTISVVSSYTNFAETGPAPGGVHPIGLINYTIDPAVTLSLAAIVPMTAANIASIDYDLTFGEGSNIPGRGFTFDDMTGLTTFVAVPAPDTSSFSFASNVSIGLLINGIADTITASSLATGQIPTQGVRIENSFVNFTDAGGVDLIDQETGSEGAIETLRREGPTFGVFDWNGQNASGTISVYRVTGLPAGPTPYSVTFTNAGPANGTYFGTAIPDTNGEVMITSADFGLVVPPSYARADVQFVFETLSTGVDMDRLLFRNDFVSKIGDGANIDLASSLAEPTGDSDTGVGE